MDISHTILEAKGKPAFVVVPYDEYLKLTGEQKPVGRIPADGATPHEVMRLVARVFGQPLGGLLQEFDLSSRAYSAPASHVQIKRT